MTKLASVVAAFLLSLALGARATPVSFDATGLWINADESGWGVSIYHQGETLFASLFVYGPDGQPRWYTSSSMRPGPRTYSGALTEATGPYFGAATFDSGSVVRRTVGTMTLRLDDTGMPIDGFAATLSFSIDGTQVSKRVSRFNMRALNLGGNYVGALQQSSSAVAGGSQVVIPNQMIDVFDGSTLFRLDVFSSNGSRYCQMQGSTREQHGGFVTVAGLSGCGSGSPALTEPWTMTVDPTPHGFVGSFKGAGVTNGHIAAALRGGGAAQGLGWLNDLWFPRSEAGWGLNLIEQGDTVFATLFVYDAQGRPKWYSASQLKAGMQDFRPTWIGSLEETTGPYFGAAFDPSMVKRRVVGSLAVQTTQDGDALLAYTVDGVLVQKRLSRFAFTWNDLTGRYVGGLAMLDPGTSAEAVQFSIEDRIDRVTVRLDIQGKPQCVLAGPATQSGAKRSVSGTYTCQDGSQGNFRMDDLLVTALGITGSYAGPGTYTNITRGNIAGARAD